MLTVPASGRRSPSIVRRSTDLPAPEPPTTPSTSPEYTSRSTPSCTTCSPNRLTTPRIEMMGALDIESEIQLHEDHREHGVEEDHQKDGLHHRDGRETA